MDRSEVDTVLRLLSDSSLNLQNILDGLDERAILIREVEGLLRPDTPITPGDQRWRVLLILSAPLAGYGDTGELLQRVEEALGTLDKKYAKKKYKESSLL
jgi:hypothetical protein